MTLAYFNRIISRLRVCGVSICTGQPAPSLWPWDVRLKLPLPLGDLEILRSVKDHPINDLRRLNNVRADQDIYLISQFGFAVAATTSPESPVLREFYDAYDLAFTLTNEKEEFAGFADCLALNQGEIYAGLSAHLGGFREYAVTIRAPVTGEFIGGMNFIVLPMGGLKTPQAHICPLTSTTFSSTDKPGAADIFALLCASLRP